MLSYATVEFHLFYDGTCKYEPFLQVVRVESDTQVIVKAVVSFVQFQVAKKYWSFLSTEYSFLLIVIKCNVEICF